MLSLKSAARLRNAVQWMEFFSELKTVHRDKKRGKFQFRLNFITLTLSLAQKHSDTEILHHMLFPFLKWMERRWKVTAWIWRAEIQEKRLAKRGERCIHFHIATSSFVHYLSIKEKWNQLQLAHGYREANTNPNSTDVHRVKESDEVARYMSKYITKPVKNKKLAVKCKIYGMSRNLSKMKILLKEEDYPRFSDELEEFLGNYCKEKFETDHGMIYYHDITPSTHFPAGIKELFWELKELYTKGITAETEYYLDTSI